MIRITPEEIISRHLECDKIIESVSMTTNYQANNRAAKKLERLYEILKDDIELAKHVYEVLLEHKSATTLSHAAAACLRLGIFIPKSEKILEELSIRTDIGIRRLNCEMILKTWRGEIPDKTL